MKAMVIKAYGGNAQFELAEVEKPGLKAGYNEKSNWRTKMSKIASLLIVSATIISGCNTLSLKPTEEDKVVLRSDVNWEKLNPARGDKSPKAGTLWGDRKADVPTGFLVEFVDGFESPAHIHNVSYRGVVISGLVHNDDEEAADMWMPAGSFWTQPKGEAHITAAKGKKNVAYIEIESGPYLVMHKDEAFDSGERPVNVDKSNVVWLDASQIKWIDQSGAKVAFLWGNPEQDELFGSFIKLPAGFKGTLNSLGKTFRGVVIKGEVNLKVQNDDKILEAGSYFGAQGKTSHQLTNNSDKDVLIYIRTDGKYVVN